ncbi:putative peptidoglycan binding domain-containing protein [Thiomicrospira sp. S5]|uniref:putative peptidoglycan binding domain-containing protein n=1 Tax=Thiomicrospira sp. S5 TaxID=1803865 RepID=UPI000F8A1F24|nr:putative peptidoglycan binding domain-containing protein [Thiomicrospira sp. S5]AZR81205.1 hypothetical protein AYJ59_02175 [Thiomicrospira sp. S5]
MPLFLSRTRLVLFSVLMVMAQVAQAGLLSFLGDVSSISSAMSGKGGNVLLPDYEREVNQQIQKSLQIQGYYTGEIDGNLNTYDSRKAIMAYQKAANLEDKMAPGFFGGKSLFHVGILDNNSKQDLLYYYELAEEFEANTFGVFQNQPQLKTLNTAAKALEKALTDGDNTVLSDSMQKTINATTRKELPVIKLNALNDQGYVVDTVNGFVWQDKDLPSFVMSYGEAKKYCKNLTLDGINKWILPWESRLTKLAGHIDKGRTKLIFTTKTPVDYVWSTDYRSAYRLDNGKYVNRIRSTAAVRCVYKY